MKNLIYIKSVYTGQCYATENLPKFGGYELITEAEYIAWCKANGIEPRH